MSEHEKGHGRVLFWTILGGTILAAVYVFRPFFVALLWASVLAVLMYPVYRFVSKRFSKNFSALVATLITAIVIVVPFAGLGTVVGIQVYHFANQLIEERAPGSSFVTIEQIAAKADDLMHPVLSQVGIDVDVERYIIDNKSNIVSAVRGPLTKFVLDLGYTIVTLSLALITMFFMLRDGPRLLDPVCELVPLPREETVSILSNMRATIESVFVGVLLVSIIQGLIAGTAYYVLGVPSPLLWALITTVFCTIPMLGAPVVYVPLAIKLIIDGHIAQALILLAVGFGIVSVIDNFLRPIFIGSRSELHPMAIFFALLGGVVFVGPIGIMVGPIVLTLLLGLVDVLRARRRLDAEQAATEEAYA